MTVTDPNAEVPENSSLVRQGNTARPEAGAVGNQQQRDQQ